MVIFGVTGDLARKKLMPAIYDLANRGLLPPGFSLVGFARRDWEDEDFAQITHDAVKEHARTPFRETVWQQLPEGVRFVPGEFSDDAAFDQLRQTRRDLDARARHRRQLRLLPVGPAEVLPRRGPAAQGAGLSDPGPRRRRHRAHAWRRVVIEKPFGHDLESAQELNAIVDEVFPAESVFRIDHYLGKETVQNILALRFANTCSSRSGTATTSTTCRSPWPRTSAIGGRAGYYDGIGAARDVIQNHLLQLLALTAMEEPVSFEADSLRAEKEKVLSAVRLPDDLAAATARGQYAAGWQGGEQVHRLPRGGRHPAGLQHRDLRRDQARRRHPPLGGRPVLPAHRQAAGAAGHRDRGGVQARAAPAVRGHRHRGARPERPGHPGPAGRGHHGAVRLQGARHGDGGPRRHHGLRLRRVVHRVQPEAYERLILDVLIGDAPLFPRHEEVELSWRILDPIEEFWAENAKPEPVPGGHAGPRVRGRDAGPRRPHLAAAVRPIDHRYVDLTDTTAGAIAAR